MGMWILRRDNNMAKISTIARPKGMKGIASDLAMLAMFGYQVWDYIATRHVSSLVIAVLIMCVLVLGLVPVLRRRLLPRDSVADQLSRAARERLVKED